ncbi:MAG: penicillin acylase family protein [Gammaproteobacteria bacterium]
MKSLFSRIVLGSILIALCGTQVYANPGYEAEVRRTSFGIPHIKADNWGSLGYGYGYAYAGDNLCVLAREVVEANGQQALYFGSSPGRINSDLFYTLSNNEQTIDDIIAQMDQPAVDGIIGFAEGYNRYLNETGIDNIAVECRSQPWVREIDERDLFKVYYKLILRASGGPLRDLIVSAVPPPTPSGGPSRFNIVDVNEKKQQLFNSVAKADLSIIKDQLNPQELGSNMYALGSNATQSGRGMVLGNPHFPWNGPLRWYQVHLTIPGEVDVMGASLQGIPLVNIGFTDTFAWSHTVSPADRFTVFELELVPGNPTQYMYDGVPTDMEEFPVSIQVDNNGVIETVNHTFYRSVQGWVMDIGPLLGFGVWNSGVSIFAVGDANADNYRAINQFYRMNLATNLTEFVEVLEELTALPWVHTVAASESGTAFYGDLSVIPNVSAAKIVDCAPAGVGTLLIAAADLKVLDGSDSNCAWTVSPDAAQPGAVPSSELPTLTTQDYVTNSNDNHWLTNPDMPITGIVPTAGVEESARSLRTRLGIKQVQERLAGTDGQGAPGYTLETLKEALFGSRNYAAELLVDDLVQLCIDEGESVVVDGTTVDLIEACSVLGNWDKRQNNDSFGAHIFLEFLQSAFDDLNDPILTALWAVPFDVNDPVNTPRDLKATDQADKDQVMQWLGRGVKRLNDFGIAMSAAWGDLQYTERGGAPLPIHGGRDGSGMFSIISANLSSAGYTPISGGNSYMQVVTFDDNGPIAEALLSYSQSSDVNSPHYSDQTVLYSNKQWVSLPFKEADILADPNYTTQTLIGIKDSDGDGIGDDVDNCLDVANAPQRDTDGDGFGNRCDPDFDNTGIVNFLDLSYIASVFNTADPDGDLNGDGAVNFLDFAIFRDYFLSPPGPSAPQPTLTTFTANVQPIFLAKCAPCHTGTTPGAFNFAGDYGSNLLPAEIPECAGLNVGQCALARIQSGEMPFGQGCTGDPAQDVGIAACLTASELSTVQAWIADGLPE